MLCAFQIQMTRKNWGRCGNLPITSFLELTQRSPWEGKLECKPCWRLISSSWYALCSCSHYWLNCWKCNPEWEGKLKSVVKNWVIFFLPLTNWYSSELQTGLKAVVLSENCFWQCILLHGRPTGNLARNVEPHNSAQDLLPRVPTS